MELFIDPCRDIVPVPTLFLQDGDQFLIKITISTKVNAWTPMKSCSPHNKILALAWGARCFGVMKQISGQEQISEYFKRSNSERPTQLLIFEGEGWAKKWGTVNSVDIHFQNAHKTQKLRRLALCTCVYCKLWSAMQTISTNYAMRTHLLVLFNF